MAKLEKLPRAQALAAAKHFGYSGADTDTDAIRAVLVGKAAEIETPGWEVDYATVAIEGEPGASPARKTYSFAPTITPQNAMIPGTLPEGWDVKLAAAVDERIKRLGLVDANGQARPVVDQNRSTVAVKSMEERYYESKVKMGQATFSDYNTAKGAAHFLLAMMGKQHPSFANRLEPNIKALENWANHNQMDGKAFASNVYNQGAPLVPLIFMPDLIRLVNEHGAARKLVTPIRMPGQELVVPRRTGGLTMYYPLENAAATQSNITNNNVTLRAKTGQVLTVCSVQSLDDSGIDLADLVYKEMALAIASGEDDAFFIGDGTSTYGGIVGIARSMGTDAGSATTAQGYRATGGTTTSAHALADIWQALSLLPDYARKNLRIACTPAIAEMCFSRLATSTGVGGLLRSDVEGGGFTRQFYGIPIFLNNKMNTRNDASTGTNPTGFTAADDIDFIVGDFSLSTKFGDRMQVELAMDMSRGFDTYSVYFRGVTRFDINHHDVGTSAAGGTGPVIAFWQT